VSTDNIRSVVYYATNSGKLDQKTEGVATSYAYDYTALKGNGINYASPVLHHVLLKGEHSGGMGALTKGGISVISQRKSGRHDKQAMHITLQQSSLLGTTFRAPCLDAASFVCYIAIFIIASLCEEICTCVCLNDNTMHAGLPACWLTPCHPALHWVLYRAIFTCDK
jgi:hypothetical protein